VADKNMLKKMIEGMASQNPPVEIFLSEGKTSYIFYKDSFLLSKLKYYPFIQLFIIGLFVLVSYWLFSLARKGEQNLVWVGMAKETAHQLGTPLSSMLAWMEILKSGQVSNQTIAEMEKDLSRLETITDRFSKIGSVPKLEKNDVIKVLNNVLSYVKTRSSEKVQFRLNADNELYVKLNIPLFEWVIENLLKNAIDAMDGEGIITIEVTDQSQVVYVDVTDTGKGIPSSKQNTVFQPGYTTKKRGWGLGLSLAKRIIDEYHNGKIFVKWSEPGKGTTFRIVLKK
jgi:two-component system, sporulation sensor kinase D